MRKISFLGVVVVVFVCVFTFRPVAADRPAVELTLDDTQIHYVSVPDNPTTKYRLLLENERPKPQEVHVYAVTHKYFADPGFDYQIEHLDARRYQWWITLGPRQTVELTLIVTACCTPTQANEYPVKVIAESDFGDDVVFTVTVRQ